MSERVTGDDPATCALCGKETSLAMIASHLIDEHGVDPGDIADAPVIDTTALRLVEPLADGEGDS